MLKTDCEDMIEINNFNKIFYKINDKEFYSLIIEKEQEYILIYNSENNIIKSFISPDANKHSSFVIKKINNNYLLFNQSVLQYITTDFSSYKIPNIRISLDDIKNIAMLSDGKIIIVKRTFNGNYKTIGYITENCYDWSEIFKLRTYNTTIINCAFDEKCFICFSKNYKDTEKNTEKDTENDNKKENFKEYEEYIEKNGTLHYFLFSSSLVILNKDYSLYSLNENIHVNKLSKTEYLIFDKNEKQFYKLVTE